ncbi:MAG: FAD-dependent oxidoreductase [Rhizobiaceae bacterium]
MKILIVGAGPTGLTAATELARRGVIPTIVDRRQAASTLSRAVGITPRSLGLLKPSGVAGKLICEGVAMDGLRVYLGRSLSLEMPLFSERTEYPCVLGMPQDRTEAIMSETLASFGGSVRFGLGFEDYEGEGDQVMAHFSDGTSEKFDTIIGADGIRSTVREAAGISYPGFDLDQTWSIADVDVGDWQHPNKITLVNAGPGQTVVVAPLGTTRYRVVASAENALDTLPLPIDVTNIRREGTFKISVRHAQTYSRGRIHLAGDAAHCHAPVGGRGMNLGIADATELAMRLVEGGVDGYSQKRHQQGHEAMRITERGRKLTGGLSWRHRLAFRTIIASANYLPPVRARLGRFLVEF